MRVNLSISLALTAMLLPLSCSKTDVQEGAGSLPGNRVLELTVGSGPATKASAGKTAWIPGRDKILVSFAQPTESGIAISEGFYNIKNSDGGTEPDGKPILWQNTNPASIHAWYWPSGDFSAKIDISDQSTPEKVRAVDALSASVSDVKFGTKPNLSFGHALAKIRILWRDESILWSNWRNPEVLASNARFFSNSMEVSLEKESTGLYALKAGGDAGWIVPYETEQMTWECLIPAQTISGTAIKLMLQKGDETPYESAVLIEETTFEAGKTYSYTLVSDPMNSKVEVAVSNIHDWSTEENGGNLTLKELVRLETAPAKDGVIRIEKDADITGETENTVEIADGCKVDLWGVKIHGGIITEGNVTLNVHGYDNLVETSEDGMPGIWPKSGGTLTIKGTEEFRQQWSSQIEVYSKKDAAAIGGGTNRPAGNIIITGWLSVNIVAGWLPSDGEQYTSDSRGAGIGGGYDNAPCGDITISDGVRGAAVCMGDGAGIGGGAKNSGCGNISILAARMDVYQYDEGYGAAIGGGYDNSPCGDISIAKGNVDSTTNIDINNADRENVHRNTKGSGIGGGVKNSGCGTIDLSYGYMLVFGPQEGAGIGDGVDNSPCQGIFIRTGIQTGIRSIEIYTSEGTSSTSGTLTFDGDYTIKEPYNEYWHYWAVYGK